MMTSRIFRPGLPSGAARVIGEAFRALANALEAGFPPGLAAAIVDRDGLAAATWGGRAAAEVPVRRDTVFDLASLTKVVATTPLVLRLAQEGRWGLDEPVARWVTGFRLRDITLCHCLTHTSGLPAHREFYREVSTARALRQALFAVEPERNSGEAVTYSDLNYMLLGWAAARCGGDRLDRLAQHLVLEPLGMAETRYRPPARWRGRLAASEVLGIVHDENTRVMGGVSGHAGLFSTLEDLARFAVALLAPDRHPVLRPEWLAAAGRRWAGEPPDERGLGWRVRPEDLAPGWPADTIGHTGFTGTSLVIAPGAGLAAVLLSNATHPVRRPGGAIRLRRAFHSALTGLLERPRLSSITP